MSLERKLGLSLIGLRSFVSGVLLFGAINCGAEGTSAKGCKNDNDCKGDRYCDESTKQCVSESVSTIPTDTSSPQRKLILNEEFINPVLDYPWASANCTDGSCPDWDKNCKGNCPAAKDEDYHIDKGILNMKDSLAYGIGELGEGIVLEYQVRNVNSELGYAAGLRNSSELFIGCWENSSFIICDISGGSGTSLYEKTFSKDPSQWQTVKIAANAQKAEFTVGGQTQEIALGEDWSISSLGLYLYLFEEGEYDYIKVWKE